MPIYEYKCKKCKEVFEALVKASETPKCPKCSSEKLEKLISGFAAPAASKHRGPCGNDKRGCSHSSGCGC